MAIKRLNLFGSREKDKKLSLSDKFLRYQRDVRNIALFDNLDDEDIPQAIVEMKQEYIRQQEYVKLDKHHVVKFDAIPDYDTGYGHLNIALLDDNYQVLLENEAISDGLGGEREIVFDPNRCYDITELGKKVLDDKIIKFKIEL